MITIIKLLFWIGLVLLAYRIGFTRGFVYGYDIGKTEIERPNQIYNMPDEYINWYA